MKRYRDFISDEILSDLEDTQSSESDCRSNLQAEGLALKPETARIFAFALISRVMSHRNDVHNATGAEAKIDKMSDQSPTIRSLPQPSWEQARRKLTAPLG